MKIIYLLPPSEGKNTGPHPQPLSSQERGVGEKLSFPFEKPLEIAINATQKDLKCKGHRYEEGIELNTSLLNSLSGKERELAASSSPGGEELRRGISEVLPAISRYSGVMYNAIDYVGMSEQGKKYFDEHFLILSGMYGLLRPQDMIGNYKLPIESKGLYNFWGEQITQTLNSLNADYIVDMLPGSYARMIQWENINTKIVRINFYKKTLPLEKGVPDEGGGGIMKKITHGVKKVKGEYIKKLCECAASSLLLGVPSLALGQTQNGEGHVGEKVQISENEYHINIISQ